MNVSVEILPGLERKLTIAIEGEKFESEISVRLAQAKQKAKIPGFRAGKVPIKEVRRRYGPAIRAEVAGEMMQTGFFEAIQQEALNPAGTPKLDVVKMDPGTDLEFTAIFDVYPKVELGDFSSMEIKKPQADIEEADLEEMVEKLRDQHTTYEAVERASAEEDQVKVDFSGTLDGEKVESASGEGVVFSLGKGQMIKDFEDALVGVSASEQKSFDATFPEDYRAEELQGKTVQFHVKVLEVLEAKKPELNEDFFKKLGVEEGGQDKFMEELRNNMQKELDSSITNQTKQQVMDSLAKMHEFALPSDVVQREIQALKEQMLGQFQQPPGNPQKIDLPDDLFRDQAEKRVKVGLVVNEIISAREIKVEETDLESKLTEMASVYGEPEQVISWYKNNPDQMRGVEMGLLEDRVIDLILEEAKVEQVEAPYGEVLSGAALAPFKAESEVNEETEKQD